MNKKEIEFLKESNAIEREYSEEALEDSKDAWILAKRNKGVIDIKFICKIHRQIMKTLNPEIAGKIRDKDVWVGSQSKGFRKCLDPKLIKEDLSILCTTYNTISKFIKKNEFDYKKMIIKNWHIEFEKIHPFFDGNGRTGRILMNIQRLQLGLPLLIIHEGLEQQKYYKWFMELNV